MTMSEMLINGRFVKGASQAVVRGPFDDSVVGTAAEGGLADLESAVDAAHHAFAKWRMAEPGHRQRLLNRIAALIREEREDLAELLTDEVGKPIVWSLAEVDRMALTFSLSAEEAGLGPREDLDLGFDPRGAGYQCVVERMPLGVVFGIVPYNWPFNLAAHKVGPAIASGNAIVLKTSPLAPLSTLTLGRIIHDAGCPAGVVNIVNASACDTQSALEDERVKMLSFTGSAAVGWKLKSLFPNRRTILELGGDASVLVFADADLNAAVPKIVSGGYGYAGQICISVQHVRVERSIYDAVRERLIRATEACPTGDPRDVSTVCGPVINLANADRVTSWIQEAVDAGASVIAGGARQGTMLRPTLLEGVPSGVRLAHEEVFGPVMTLTPFDDLQEAIDQVNGSEYGIQCGVFTTAASTADACFDALEVGGVVINDVPTLRFDNMPYGGVKRSGIGREGVRYAMAEMTEPKTRVERAGTL